MTDITATASGSAIASAVGTFIQSTTLPNPSITELPMVVSIYAIPQVVNLVYPYQARINTAINYG